LDGFAGYVKPTNYVFFPIRESEVVSPSDMIAMGDASLNQSEQLIWGDARLPVPFVISSFYNEAMRGLPATDQAVKATQRRHGGRWNVSFCDGHVENL